MRYFLLLLCCFLIYSCKNKAEKNDQAPFKSVKIKTIYKDSVSIRALEILEDNSLAFAGSDGKFGLYNPNTKTWNTGIQLYDTIRPSFRATAHTTTDFFMMSIANPALIYKTGDDGAMKLVYSEKGDAVFYDAMRFWNDREGIAIGDPVENCMSMVITRDGGTTWTKIPCDVLPQTISGEAAFAASNTNIAIVGDQTWVLTGGMQSRVLYSPDKGVNWEVFTTPLIQGTSTTGGYSIDFYDEKIGYIIGGDYTNPSDMSNNKAFTQDGGKTWEVTAADAAPGYKSCVQFVPESNGNGLVAVGFTGISYTSDRGKTWQVLSDESFYTLRFIDSKLAYAAGKGRIAFLEFNP